MKKNNTYQEQYGEALTLYKTMLESYEELIFSSRYHEILSCMPFEFLNATQLCEKLTLFEKLDIKTRMNFTSADEAIVFYRNLVQFNRKTNQLLEDASYITNIGSIAAEINDYVMNSPYLGDTYCVQPNMDVISIAKKCLLEIPHYPQKLTKKFRWNFIESVIISLPKEDLKPLVDTKIIKTEDLDNISLINDSEAYTEKIEYLCNLLQRPLPYVCNYALKLKGVTFPNADGSSRQDNLNELIKYKEEHKDEIITLSAEKYIYTPEIGDNEPAIRILWNGKEIGNIAKDVVQDIEERFVNPHFSVTLKEVTGGDKGLNYGCMVDFNITYSKKLDDMEIAR